MTQLDEKLHIILFGAVFPSQLQVLCKIDVPHPSFSKKRFYFVIKNFLSNHEGAILLGKMRI